MVPTEMVIEVGKLQSVALLQLKDFKGNTIKLRDLKWFYINIKMYRHEKN